MIRIKKKFTAQDQQILLETYYEKDFSITVINEQKKVLFLQDMIQSYTVDELHKSLISIPNSNNQLYQIKNLIGEVWLDKAYHLNGKYQQQCYMLANNFISAPAKLTGELAVCVDERLSGTTNFIQNSFDNERQFFQLPLAKNETISYLKTAIEVNGQTVVSTMEVTSIEDAFMPQQFREFLNYTDSAKAA